MPEPGAGIYMNLTERLLNVDVTLTGYMQSWKYFVHVEEQIRHEFSFPPDFIDVSRRRLDAYLPLTWRGTSFTRVVIHVRRGDYADFLDLERNYFNKSMSYYTNCRPRVQFIVLSDDIPWCLHHRE